MVTFYEHVTNKEALAALPIHMCVKQQVQVLQVSTERQRGMLRAEQEVLGAVRAYLRDV